MTTNPDCWAPYGQGWAFTRDDAGEGPARPFPSDPDSEESRPHHRGHRRAAVIRGRPAVVSTGEWQPAISRLLLPHSALCLITICTAAPVAAQEPTDLRRIDLPSWTLEETLRLGSLDGRWDAFVSPRLPIEGPNGELVLLDQGLPAVRVFGREGEHLRDLGGEGEGPGEFVSPASIGAHDDRVWIADPRQRRFTEFHIDGRVLRTETLPAAGPSRLAIPVERTDGGRYVALDPPSPPLGISSAPGRITFSQAVVRLDTGMEVLDTLAVVQVESPLLTTGGSNVLYFDPLPSWPMILHVEDRGRFRIDRSSTGGSEGPASFRVTWIEHDQSPDSAARIFHDTRSPVPDSTRSRIEAQMADQLDGYPPSVQEAAQPLMRDRILDIEPPVASANVDPAGRLWLLRERYRSDPHWLVLDASLQPVARVPVPASGGHTPFFGFTGPDELWLRVEGELGTARLVRYRIDRG